MWRAVWVAMVLAAPTARAEDPTKLRAEAITETPPAVDPIAPWSQLDPLPHSDLEAIDSLEGHVATRRALDARTWVTVAADTWADRDGSWRTSSRGWRAGLTLSRDVGIARLDLGVSYNEAEGRELIDGGFQRGHYAEITAALIRTKKLSRWMTAWISLGVGLRTWRGPPPPGEHNAAQVMLTIGTTFR